MFSFSVSTHPVGFRPYPAPRRRCLAARLVLIAALPVGLLRASGPVINFDNLPNRTSVNTQYAGLVFQNAVVLSKGLGLNESDFPPRSGANVIFDGGGAITILFNSPIQSFAGFFTYTSPVTIQAFASGGAQVATATSLFASNGLSSGVAGSSPNELIQVASQTGITKLTITGNSSGRTFTLDDITVSLANPCDVSGDGSVSIADVQLAINRALGSAAGGIDVNSDGVWDVRDVQTVINASQGRGCSGA